MGPAGMLNLAVEIPSYCLPCASFESKDAQSSTLLSLGDGSKLASYYLITKKKTVKPKSLLI